MGKTGLVCRSVMVQQLSVLAVVAVALLARLSLEARPPERPIDIGSRLELFLDDHLIDSIDNLSFELHSPRPAERVLHFDAPWEGQCSDYVTVLQDGDRFRMYYASHLEAPRKDDPRRYRFDGPNQVTCYAESRDGIHWTKPKLGMVEFEGSRQNNIILQGQTSHNFAPFVDNRPGIPEDERYKAVGGWRAGFIDKVKDIEDLRIHVFASADGLHWRRFHDEPLAISNKARFDSQNVAFWDADQKQYAFYFRDLENGIRHVARSTSGDFINWTDPQLINVDGAPQEHLYTNATIPYFRAPHFYLAFPMRYVPSRDPLVEAVRRGVCDGLFMFSRDGLRFSRRHAEAFIRPGPERRNWTKHSIMPAWGLLRTADDEISIYYSQHYFSDSSHLRRGAIRLDGFVSLKAPHRGGQLTTKPLVFSGDRLVINAETSAAGGVRCEIQDADGEPLDGYRLADAVVFYGDETSHTVRWKGSSDLGSLRKDRPAALDRLSARGRCRLLR